MSKSTDSKYYNFNIQADALACETIHILNKIPLKKKQEAGAVLDVYTVELIKTAMAIQKISVFLLSEDARKTMDEKKELAKASSNCAYLAHVVRVAIKEQWITPTQRANWISQADETRRAIQFILDRLN